jgi:hypothetical protein
LEPSIEQIALEPQINRLFLWKNTDLSQIDKNNDCFIIIFDCITLFRRGDISSQFAKQFQEKPMNKKFLTLACISISLFGAPAFAEEDLWDSNWQVSLGGARNTQSGTKSNLVQARLRRDFGDFIAIEAEAAFSLSQSNVGNIKAGLDNEFAGFAVLKTPDWNGFEAFGRIGYASTKFSNVVGGSKVSNSEKGLAYGVGTQYFFDGANGVRFDFTRFNRSGTNLNVFSLAYTRRF